MANQNFGCPFLKLHGHNTGVLSWCAKHTLHSVKHTHPAKCEAQPSGVWKEIESEERDQERKEIKSETTFNWIIFTIVILVTN